jgi:hypothetical protein
MPNATSELERFLDELARDAQPGDQLPTIRELMRRFGASQVMVQRAFENLKARGLIASQVGRGTHFLADGRPASTVSGPGVRAGANATYSGHARLPAVRSVLLLRRSISIARGRVLVESLQRRFTAEGHRVLEVSYTDPDHARTVLKSLPRFDACVVQSTYKTITIDLLAALREKSEVVAVDGAALVGTDVEAVGMEWGEPLAEAISLLQQRGHRRIACASTSHPFLATQLGWRRFDSLQKTLTDVELHAIAVPLLPDQDYASRLVDSIKASLDAAGRPPFTALVAWGIEDGDKFRQLLADIGITVPSTLSVVLLGRTDLANEHADFFDTVGCSVADQVESLYQAIQARWADPACPYGVRLIPITRRAGQSTATMAVPPAAPPTADRSRARRSRS